MASFEAAALLGGGVDAPLPQLAVRAAQVGGSCLGALGCPIGVGCPLGVGFSAADQSEGIVELLGVDEGKGKFVALHLALIGTLNGRAYGDDAMRPGHL